MKVLLTNTSLAHRTGTELYVVELARALRGRGHAPIAYSPVLGAVAEELRAAGVPVVDDLAAVAEPPDLVHGQHHLETLTALLHFPGVPGIFVCHGALPWEEHPPRFPRLLRYVAVDEPTRERITAGAGVAAERVETILNFVDLGRFQPRPPLPPRPLRALVFSNNASEKTHLPAVRQACSEARIAVDAAGIACGAPAACPEELLPAYDLVFAKGRAALEAMAVGAAVVLCDAEGCGPLVTAGEIDRLRPLNFGMRTLREPLSTGALAREIARYDPDDAGAVSRRIRAEAGLELAVDRYLRLYDQVLAEHARVRAGADPLDALGAVVEEERAAAAYLAWLGPFLRERGRLLIDRDELWRRVRQLGDELAASRRGREAGDGDDNAMSAPQE
ncbi:MAG TPA: glycosyltransferase [Thermoanaerobaculia bacterium]|nr:glycosyltransferase [Thermoanaerobaculia bacterium]